MFFLYFLSLFLHYKMYVGCRKLVSKDLNVLNLQKKITRRFKVYTIQLDFYINTYIKSNLFRYPFHTNELTLLLFLSTYYVLTRKILEIFL